MGGYRLHRQSHFIGCKSSNRQDFKGKLLETLKKTLCSATCILTGSWIKKCRNAFGNLQNVTNIRAGNIDPKGFAYFGCFQENSSTSWMKPRACNSGKIDHLQLGSRDHKFPKNMFFIMGYI